MQISTMHLIKRSVTGPNQASQVLIYANGTELNNAHDSCSLDSSKHTHVFQAVFVVQF